MPLTIPQPTLSSPGVTGNVFGAEKPINLVCGPVTLPDGATLGPATATHFGFQLFREIGPGATEVWDEKDHTWAPLVPSLEDQPLFPEGTLWKAILVAVGQKDKAGNDKFATDRVTGFPRYFARCGFRARDPGGTEHAGASPRSAAVSVLALGDRDRAGLAINPKSLPDATEVRIFLKDALGGERGTVAIRESGGGFVVELAASGGSVRLTSQGEIVLAPASGRGVRIEGDLAVSGAIRVAGTLVDVP